MSSHLWSPHEGGTAGHLEVSQLHALPQLPRLPDVVVAFPATKVSTWATHTGPRLMQYSCMDLYLGVGQVKAVPVLGFLLAQTASWAWIISEGRSGDWDVAWGHQRLGLG